MASYNKIIIVGRLTKDPELRYTAGGLAVVKFAVAVDRRFKNQQGERVTDFFDCSAFRQTAEFVSNYVTKGRMVLVEGSIEFNEATGQDGQKRRYTNVIADSVQTLDSARDLDNAGAASGSAPQGAAKSANPGASPATGSAARRPAVEPAYPEDDFDDSDPFADQ
jgi:single-strand DNA-binding protein